MRPLPRHLSGRPWLPLAVFIVGLGLTALAMREARENAQAVREGQLQHEAGELEKRILTTVQTQQALLRGGAALFGIKPEVDQTEFSLFCDRTVFAPGLPNPGIRGVGFSRRIAAADLAAFLEKTRRTLGPDFIIHPEGERSEYHAILFRAPVDEKNKIVVGLDMFTEPIRQAAMKRAWLTGQTCFTGKIILANEPQGSQEPGFLAYTPAFRGGLVPQTESQRQELLLGFMYGAFRAHDFFDIVLRPVKGASESIHIFDGTAPSEATLLYSTGQPAGPGMQSADSLLNIPGHKWTLRVAAASKSVIHDTAGIALVGLGFSGVLAFLVRAEGRARNLAVQREAELRRLLNSIPAMVAYVGRDQTYQVINSSYAEWYGKTAEELQGRAMAEIMGPAAYSSVLPFVERALAGEHVHFERWTAPPSRTAHFLSVTYLPRRRDATETDGFFVLIIDLTERKRSEERTAFLADTGKILSSSLDYAATLRNVVRLAVPIVADYAALFQLEGNRLVLLEVQHSDAAQAARLMALSRTLPPFGADAGHGLAESARTGVPLVVEVTDERINSVLHDEQQRAALKALRLLSILYVPVAVRGHVWGVIAFATAASGRKFVTEDLRLAADLAGRARLAIENALLYAEAQQQTRERLRTESALVQSEQRFRLLVERTEDYAIILLDNEGRVSEWNTGAERILGYSSQEILGQDSAIFFTPEAREQRLPELEKAKALQAGVSLQEGWRMRKDGTRFWASGHFISLGPAEGQQGFAKILRDLTERKHAADELERLNHELESRVERRTAELQEAVGELEAFSYSVSHDLRSPLRAMQGYAEALLEEAAARLQAPEQDYLRRILNSAERLDRLISDVLAYSRISKAEITLKPIAMEWLLKEVINENPAFHLAQAEVRVEGPMPKVLAHEASLVQCFANLLGNAVKFVAPGTKPQVRIWSERADEFVRVNFQDNGIGIPEQSQGRIFEMFQRLNDRRQYDGTGVGLTIVRRAMQRMGGRVGLRSTVNQGSTFWLDLPPA